jgi:BioD-like phosphotransacetylase family protein
MVVDHHAKDMTHFKDKDVLLDEDLADFEENSLKELIVIVEITGQEEFGLELHPDWM